MQSPGQEALASRTLASQSAGTVAWCSGPGGRAWSPTRTRARPSSGARVKTFGSIAWHSPDPVQKVSSIHTFMVSLPRSFPAALVAGDYVPPVLVSVDDRGDGRDLRRVVVHADAHRVVARLDQPDRVGEQPP